MQKLTIRAVFSKFYQHIHCKELKKTSWNKSKEKFTSKTLLEPEVPLLQAHEKNESTTDIFYCFIFCILKIVGFLKTVFSILNQCFSKNKI